MEKTHVRKKVKTLLGTSGLFQSVVLIIIVVGAFFMGSLWTKVQILEKGGVPTSVKPAQQETPQQKKAASLDDVKNAFNKGVIKFGDTKKKLILVEVADPSCPYCAIAAGKNPELNKEAGGQFQLKTDGGSYVPPVPEFEKLVKEGKAAFVYLYTPGHGNGEMGVKSMYCAFEKGKFWEVHDKLMTSDGYDILNNTVKNDKTKSAELAQFLSPVFDAGQMKSCLDSGKYDGKPAEETTIARGLGISGTPGFYINAQLFPGAYNFTEMETAVKSAL